MDDAPSPDVAGTDMGNADMANADEAEYWNGERGQHWVDHDEHHDRMLRPFDAHLLDTAAVDAGMRVVDVGCGCGHTTRAAARRAERGDVLGVDLSAPMLARARELADAAGLRNVRFEQADAQTHAFPAHRFDAAISRFGVMFFADLVAAFANIRAGLTAGGQLAFVCWQPLADNPWFRRPVEAVLQHVEQPGVPDDPGRSGPFSLAEPDQIRSVLGDAGYVDIDVEALHESLWLGRDPVDATTFLQGTSRVSTLLESASPDAAARAIDAVHAALEPFAGADGVLLGSGAWLVHARAR
jgi:SAM-dependent methyltransferase